MKIKNLYLFIICIAILLVVVQCKKHTHDNSHAVDASLASFDNLKIHILNHKCVSCHSAASSNNIQHGLVLEGGNVHENLVNKKSVNPKALAAGLKLILPGKADSSFFYTKCDWNTYPKFQWGSSMPIGDDLLSTKELLYIKQWINAGAPKTGVVADASLLEAH